MARKIAIASGKGGVGKTTITVNLSIVMGQLGAKVLAMDTDVAMANLSMVFGMKSVPITLHDVLRGEADILDALYDGPAGIKIVPSGLSLASYRRIDPEKLESILKKIEKPYDYILLDTPAGIEANVLSVLAVVDEVIIVTTPDKPSVANALKTKMVADRLGTKVRGVILNMVGREKEELSADEVVKLMETPVLGEIPEDPNVRRAFVRKDPYPFVLLYPETKAALAIRRIAAKLMGIPPREVVKEEKPSFIKRLLQRLVKR